MNLITHRVNAPSGHGPDYVLTDYGRGKFGLANITDNVHVWLTEDAYGEIMTAINDRNYANQACRDAENKGLEALADEAQADYWKQCACTPPGN
jgi:hypothetical protein